MTERRHDERYVFTASATFECSGARIPGATLDVSISGARMRLASRSFLHPTGIVTAPAYGMRVQGRVVWRRGADVGIRFLSDPATPALKPSFGRRLPQQR